MVPTRDPYGVSRLQAGDDDPLIGIDIFRIQDGKIKEDQIGDFFLVGFMRPNSYERKFDPSDYAAHSSPLRAYPKSCEESHRDFRGEYVMHRQSVRSLELEEHQGGSDHDRCQPGNGGI